MHRALLSWSLTRASAPGGEAFAARSLQRLQRAIPRTERGAALASELATDERWAARYLAARVLARMAPDLVPADAAWERLVALARDDRRAVREGASYGFAELVVRVPPAAEWLERLLTDGAADSTARRAALRSLVVLAVEPETAELGARLLGGAARGDERLARAVGAVILGRGIAARDPERAMQIIREWLASGDPVLRAQAERALRGPLSTRARTRTTATAGAR
jgi:hypothetical protein